MTVDSLFFYFPHAGWGQGASSGFGGPNYGAKQAGVQTAVVEIADKGSGWRSCAGFGLLPIKSRASSEDYAARIVMRQPKEMATEVARSEPLCAPELLASS